MTTTMTTKAPRTRTLRDPEVKQKLQELRRTDNWTNWLYIGRTYAVLAVVIGGAVAFREWQAAAGVSFWWNVPVWLLAVVAVGAAQHHLAGATHEATHHVLFRNRLLNELASDWLCMFPLFSSTNIFRQHHLAHHQFINDPERDPDFSQLVRSGHWLGFPVSKARFLWLLVRQLWVVNLVRYTLVRAQYNSFPTEKNPNWPSDWKPSRVPVRLGIGYILGLAVLLAGLVTHGDRTLLAVVPWAWWAVMMVAFALVPGRMFSRSRIPPVVTPRAMTWMRLTYVTLLFSALAWVTLETGRPAWLYFLLLWVVPLFTTFSFFMILRQLVQHGNGDRGWLTNTRTFLVNPFIRYAVFPFGMDYHLPHHMFASVPHYRLRRLHEFLMNYPEYAEQGTVVEGYFFPHDHHPDRNPTVLEVLGPEHAKQGDEVFIDDSVLEGCKGEERGS